MSISSKKAGFTLAEVLITLGIVGIIAVMTLPNLIFAINKMIIKNRLKKTYANVSNTVWMIHELEALECRYRSNLSTTSSANNCPAFFAAMENYTKIVKTCKGKALERGCIPNYNGKRIISPGEGCTGFSLQNINTKNHAYVFSDGSILITYSTGYMPYFILDVNGHSGPNMLGYDAFAFLIRDMDELGYKIYSPNTGCAIVEKGGKSGDSILYSQK